MYSSSEVTQPNYNNHENHHLTQFNFDFDVNYHSIHVDNDEFRDTLFREQILKFFKIEEYNQTIIDIKIEHLKPIIESNNDLKNLSIKFSNIMFQDKFDIGIIMFFAYDYFHDTFLLLKEYLHKNTINKNIYNRIFKKL
uniref:Uncharacterized protein n=1 Tax=viral metagenome TaxID=1070528 RepID=A0A6C0BRX5_9ZZZZ